MENEIMKMYGDTQIVFKQNESGVYTVKIDEVAKLCGWIKYSKGIEYIRWERVNKHLQTLGCPPVGKGEFIPEYLMYALISKGESKKATDFSIWVGKILVDLRTKGFVIMEHAEEESVLFETKYGSRRIGITFESTADIDAEYSRFYEMCKYRIAHNKMTNSERVRKQKLILKALDHRLEVAIAQGVRQNVHLIISIQDLKDNVAEDIDEGNNRSLGRKVGDKTRRIAELEAELAELKQDI
jgi:hypothetical protein